MHKIRQAQEPKKILQRGLGIQMDTTEKVSKVKESKRGSVERTTILDKTVEKIAYLGGIFCKLGSRPILPSPPLPLEAVLLGLRKKAGSLSICRKQL